MFDVLFSVFKSELMWNYLAAILSGLGGLLRVKCCAFVLRVGCCSCEVHRVDIFAYFRLNSGKVE